MFILVSALNITGSNGKQVITGLTSPDLLIELETRDIFSAGFQFERSYLKGDVFRVRFFQNGIYGSFIYLPYGTHEILLDVPHPGTPFDLELIPNRFQFEYNLKVSRRVLSPLALEMSEKWGIDASALELIPYQTLLTLKEINIMASSDTRNILSQVEAAAAAAQAAQTKADSASTSVTNLQTVVADVEVAMVTTETASKLKSDFSIMPNGSYIATYQLQALNGGSGVLAQVYDAQGDEQGFSQVILGYNGNPDMVAIELSATQHAENAYPLKIVFQGKRNTASVPGATLTASSGFWEYSLTSGVLSVANTNTGTTAVIESNPTALVVDAYLLNGAVYTLDTMGNYWYYQEPDHNKAASSSGNWATVIAQGIKLA